MVALFDSFFVGLLDIWNSTPIDSTPVTAWQAIILWILWSNPLYDTIKEYCHLDDEDKCPSLII